LQRASELTLCYLRSTATPLQRAQTLRKLHGRCQRRGGRQRGVLALVQQMRCTMYCRTSWRCSHESHALLCRALYSVELLLGLASEAGTTCSSVGAGGRLSFYTSSAELLELCSEPFKRCWAYPTRLLVDGFARLSVGKRRSPSFSPAIHQFSTLVTTA